jgi:hypothetical protein
MKWAVFIVGVVSAATTLAAAAARTDPAWDAFRDVAAVLQGPRCLGCHIPGDAPLQVDATRTHAMSVKRGADGRGTPSQRCKNCHQDTNAELAHAPPGALDWRLPPPSMRMAWLGLDASSLCRTLKDPATNGGRDLAALEEHVRSDAIVMWGWNPGPGRSPPSISHAAFVERFVAWRAAGAPCAPRSQP